jgi:D-alanyl-D-alanine carboxypeptidase
MSTALTRTAPPSRTALPRGAVRTTQQWTWLAAGLALAFAVPFLLADRWSIERDLYYGLYAAFVFGFCALWLRFAADSPSRTLTRHWRAGIALGVAFAGIETLVALTEEATSHPTGWTFAAAILWRGVVYGASDGLLLSVFPILAVFAAFSSRRPARERTKRAIAGIGALALATSVAFTAVYHLGFADFRGSKLHKPVAGDVVWSIPTLVTLSPAGAPIAHIGLHVAAVVHSYDTDTFLPPHRGMATAARPELQAVLDEIVTGPGAIAPGATAYVTGPRGTWAGAAGRANLTTGAEMQPDARMRLESVSKIWTATLVLLLAEERTLSLSDTVEDWMPGVLPYGASITIGRLLNHSSGIIDSNDVGNAPRTYFANVKDPAARARFLRLARRIAANPTREFSPLRWIELAAWQPLVTTPGTQFHYSNIGFEVLGQIAVRATGTPLATLLRERIFQPLGLGRTAYDPQGPIVGDHARAYAVAQDGTLTDATDRHSGIGASGGIVSDAKDTATFLTSLMDGELLGAAELAAMKRQAFWSGGEITGCGPVAFGHSGGGDGYKTNVWVSGDGERVAVLLLNGRAGDDFTDALAGAAMRRLYCAA